MAAPAKKYGLIIPSSKKAVQGRKAAMSFTRPSVFGNDSSSDEEAHKEVNSQIHKEAMKKKIQKQTQIEIQRALEQDATVYEYDSIYDEIKEQNKSKTPAEVSKADKQRKPKYIANLLKAAEKRAKERERIEERKIQKEREKEGDEFQDKEEFVTSAYRQKMLDRQKEIEEEKRMDAIEEALDVRKQKDLSGFYRNFLNRELCEEPQKTQSKTITPRDEASKRQDDEDTDLSFSSSESGSDREDTSKKEKQHRKQADYSSRSSSSGENGSDSHKRKSPLSSHQHYTIKDQKYDVDRPSRETDSCERGQRQSKERGKDHHHSHSDANWHQARAYRGDYRHGHKGKYHSPNRKSNIRGQRHHCSKERSRSPVNHKRRSGSRSPSKHQKRTESGHSRSQNQTPRENRDRSLEEKPEVILSQPEETMRSSFAKHTDKDKAQLARERYLARKAAERPKPIAETDSD